MRNLVITREKSFIGCLGKGKVYIKDNQAGEIAIKKVRYRKIGVLKNGQTSTFSISNDENSIVVICDKISKGFCNDFYNISAGEEDIYISGKHKFNPFIGNPFRFNEVSDVSVIKNRKRASKIGWLILFIALLIGFAIGYFLTDKTLSPKVFSNEGMSITLTGAFSEAQKPLNNITSCYQSRDVMVTAVKDEFSLVKDLGGNSLDDYGNLIIQNSLGDKSIQLQHEDGLTFFEYQYTDPSSNSKINYFSVVLKSADAFWLVQFAALDSNYSYHKPDMINWANSIEFSNEYISA